MSNTLSSACPFQTLSPVASPAPKKKEGKKKEKPKKKRRKKERKKKKKSPNKATWLGSESRRCRWLATPTADHSYSGRRTENLPGGHRVGYPHTPFFLPRDTPLLSIKQDWSPRWSKTVWASGILLDDASSEKRSNLLLMMLLLPTASCVCVCVCVNSGNLWLLQTISPSIARDDNHAACNVILVRFVYILFLRLIDA